MCRAPGRGTSGEGCLGVRSKPRHFASTVPYHEEALRPVGVVRPESCRSLCLGPALARLYVWSVWVCVCVRGTGLRARVVGLGVCVRVRVFVCAGSGLCGGVGAPPPLLFRGLDPGLCGCSCEGGESCRAVYLCVSGLSLWLACVRDLTLCATSALPTSSARTHSKALISGSKNRGSRD